MQETKAESWGEGVDIKIAVYGTNLLFTVS